MFETHSVEYSTKPEMYAALNAQIHHLLEGETDLIANAANASSLLYYTLPALNWAGFYFYKGGELVVGPFQGKPACVHIAMGKGVCGTAAQQRKTVVVKDVHAFPGHIACDSASNSEIVVPLISGGQLFGVLDLDSPQIARFDETDRAGLEEFVDIFMKHTTWPKNL